MVVEDLIEKCNDEYVRNATEYICKECSHQIKCTGNCAKCLDEVHFDRKNGTRSDYDCKYLLDYYVCRYIYAYITEMKRAFNIIKPEICDLDYINMLSIGCGPAPDLFAMIDFLEEIKVDKEIRYFGFDKNSMWGQIHTWISDICKEDSRIRVKFEIDDVFDAFKKHSLGRANVLVMQYFLSHVCYNQKDDELEAFFDRLVDHVILNMEFPAYIIINDINHYMARNHFQILERKIKQRGKRMKTHKYFFPYKHLKEEQKQGMEEHASISIDYQIGESLQRQYSTRDHCSSVQHIIEVNDR